MGVRLEAILGCEHICTTDCLPVWHRASPTPPPQPGSPAGSSPAGSEPSTPTRNSSQRQSSAGTPTLTPRIGALGVTGVTGVGGRLATFDSDFSPSWFPVHAFVLHADGCMALQAYCPPLH